MRPRRPKRVEEIPGSPRDEVEHVMGSQTCGRGDSCLCISELRLVLGGLTFPDPVKAGLNHVRDIPRREGQLGAAGAVTAGRYIVLALYSAKAVVINEATGAACIRGAQLSDMPRASTVDSY